MVAPADRASSSNSARLASKSRVRGCKALGVLFFSGDDSGRSAGKSSGGGKLLALAEFSRELDHDKHGKFLLSLRGAEFAGEERRVLGLTCFDKTAADCLSAIPARAALDPGWLRFEAFLLVKFVSIQGRVFRPAPF
jgi:hypothetical protein